MLREDLKYICLDFETTGLDPEHDEAIQIGIVSFDSRGNILNTFSSYIKPQKPLQELKDMVRVVTGLSLQSLTDAPSFEQIRSSVEPFFDDHSVIIGHNVQFDLSVLRQHMQIDPYAVIDTFPLAQSLMPFSPSYALEVLAKSVPETVHPHGSHHDALFDSYETKKVFLECISRLQKVADAYPQIYRFLKNSSAELTKIISSPDTVGVLAKPTPILTKIYTNGKKLAVGEEKDKNELPDKGKFYIGNISLKDTLRVLPKENVIFAFSQRSKTQIAKNLLHEIGLTHIDIGGHYIFDKDLLGLFFQKKQFDQGELFFALKYFYHAISNHSTIDLNNSYDWKIFHAIKEKHIDGGKKSAEILTHDQLYEKMRDQEIMPYTTIFFFDQDRWYDTHMKWEQKIFDLYSLLQIIDSCIYRDNLTAPQKQSARHTLYTKLVIFIGIWQTEVAGLLKDVSNSSVELDSIVDNTYFYKTNLLLSQVRETLNDLSSLVADDDWRLINEKWERFIQIISTSCAISTKLQGDEVHFVVRALHSFLDYSEFQQLFDMYQSIFLSHTKKDRPILLSTTVSHNMLTVEDWPGKEKLSYNAKNIYVFSNNKQTSQELLVWLHHHKPEKHRVHGENITGGKGKNIFAIKGSEYNIIIGGYDFFLQCIAQKINIDKIYTLCINGPLQHIISADLLYYGNTTLS